MFPSLAPNIIIAANRTQTQNNTLVPTNLLDFEVTLPATLLKPGLLIQLVLGVQLNDPGPVNPNLVCSYQFGPTVILLPFSVAVPDGQAIVTIYTVINDAQSAISCGVIDLPTGSTSLGPNLTPLPANGLLPVQVLLNVDNIGGGANVQLPFASLFIAQSS